MSRTAVVIFGSNSIWQLDDKPGTLFWTQILHIDCDGHPKAYHPDGSPPGLDYLANAGKPGNYWGIACNPDTTGKPYVQSSSDPAPGFYVSTTALMDGALSKSNPAKYVNAGTVPFIVLPSKPKFSSSQTLADLCVVFNDATGLSSWAIYADVGPSNQIGEGSMALADALGIPNSPKTGGTENETLAVIYFSGSRIGWPRSNDELSAQAWKLFSDWGGYDSAKTALPQINWDKFANAPIPPSPTPEATIVTVTAPSTIDVKVTTGTNDFVSIEAPKGVQIKFIQT